MIYNLFCPLSGMNSIISPGWHPSTSHIVSRVENRIALAFPVFSIERLAVVMPTLSASSLLRIFRFASITSRLMIMGMG